MQAAVPSVVWTQALSIEQVHGDAHDGSVVVVVPAHAQPMPGHPSGTGTGAHVCPEGHSPPHVL